jgi:NAD(P)-dependent dehydrogenase (short-subunit alcohol dehydrogenase family)
LPTLDNKIVIITGAKGGLGSTVTQSFLESGAIVVGVSRSIEAKDSPHANFRPMPAELTHSRGAQRLAEEVAGRFQRIDVLVHLVGGFAGGQSVADTDDATLDQMLELNVKSLFYMVRAVIPYMRQAGSGRILAIGSRAAVEPSPMAGAYSASKAALVSLIRTLAAENGDRGVTANVVLPGTMDTPANRAADPGADFSQWVQPAQVSAMLLHLASDEASQINGAVIPVYGRK